MPLLVLSLVWIIEPTSRQLWRNFTG